MSRIMVRNVQNNTWLDFCKHTVRVRSPDNRSWISVDPRKLNFRDGADSEFLQVDCGYDIRFDDPCHNKLINSINCPAGLDANTVGSGDGQGSGGLEFSIVDGYPVGYDLPDAGESGFGLERTINTYKGWSLKRPVLNFELESYDESGITPSYGRGTYANPNYLGSSVFGGGAQITETIFDVGNIEGYFEVLFASFDDVGISVDVYYLGNRIATTCGFVADRSKIEFYLDPAIGEGESRVMIRIRCRDASRWAYQFVGAKPNLAIFDLDATDINQFQYLYTSEYSGTPIFPAPCHATVFPNEVRTVDGKWFYEFFHNIGSIADDVLWDLVLDYTSWMNADKFEVYHGGVRIASTVDSKGNLGMLKFRWNPSRFAIPVPDIMIRVTTNDRMQFDDLQSWYYTLYCPNVRGYRELPWQCGTPVQGLSSMGHNSTEDNFDLDNGVNPGVVSLKVVGHGEFVYTASIFDSNMNLIESKQGTGVTYVQFFVMQDLHGDTRKKVSVRIDGPLGSSWTYYMGCPVPVLDVELDDKLVPVCEGDIELAINDIGVVKGNQAKFTITSNLPSNEAIVVNYSTQDGSATSSGVTYTELPEVYGIDNETRTEATYAIHNSSTGIVIVDASWYRLANNDLRVGVNSNINTNSVTSTYVNLSPDAKLLVNTLRQQTSNLNGKRWLILTSSDNNWAVLCSNVLDSLRSIYGLTYTVVLDDYSNVNPSNYDIVTIADSSIYSRNAPADNKDYLEQVFTNKFYSTLAANLQNYFVFGKIIHAVLFQSSSLSSAQYANGLFQEVLNRGSQIGIAFDCAKVQNRTTSQYYASNHKLNYPDTPLLVNIADDAVFDGDRKQVSLTYAKPDSSLPADYVAKTGSATIPIGSSSVSVEIETINHTTSNLGKTFFVNLDSASSGDIERRKGTATFISSSGGGSTNFNFTKSSFLSTSYNNYNNTIKGYGAALVLGIGYSQVANGKGSLSIVQPGKVAFAEVDYGDPTDLRVVVTNGVCAEYPYDPALTYEFKWELFEVFNDINNGGVVAKSLVVSSDYSPLNDIVKLSIGASHKTDPINTLRSSWSVFAYIKSSDGKIYSSQEISVSLVSNSSSYT